MQRRTLRPMTTQWTLQMSCRWGLWGPPKTQRMCNTHRKGKTRCTYSGPAIYLKEAWMCEIYTGNSASKLVKTFCTALFSARVHQWHLIVTTAYRQMQLHSMQRSRMSVNTYIAELRMNVWARIDLCFMRFLMRFLVKSIYFIYLFFCAQSKWTVSLGFFFVIGHAGIGSGELIYDHQRPVSVPQNIALPLMHRPLQLSEYILSQCAF